MERAFYRVFYCITIVVGCITMYYFLSGKYLTEDGFKAFALGVVETIVFGIFTIIAEPRPRKTELQRKHDDKIKTRGLYCLLLVFGAVIVILFMSSCSGPKYGCGHGAPKQSWNKMVRRINNGY